MYKGAKDKTWLKSAQLFLRGTLGGNSSQLIPDSRVEVIPCRGGPAGDGGRVILVLSQPSSSSVFQRTRHIVPFGESHLLRPVRVAS